ncbi:MAG: DUF5518 domain-containing protein [Candidatus Methanoculleus thermohydrogenotrophicum]|nr:DUF5518 domain-containing protein [Candidatus Methanoculleus thermohydrogenotrophicum]
MVTSAVRRSIGAVLGALVIGAALLSGVLEALPGPVVTVAFLFGGGLVAGLLTRGRIMDGAITGAVSGVVMALLVASATTIKSLVASSPQYPPPWATFGFYALVLTILLLPYNAIGGAVGTAVRNSIRRGGTPGRANGPGGSGLVSAQSSSPPQLSSSSVQFSSLTSSARCSWSLQSSAGSSRGLLPEERRGTASRLGS